jgi:hypothetical protein
VIGHGSEEAVNAFATPELLAQAPAHNLMNLFQFQNPPRSVSVQNVHISGKVATTTFVFSFGSKVSVSKAAVWAYTASGWKIAGAGGFGRG